MSGGPQLALGRSADQRGLEIEGILERGVRVWERPLRVVSRPWVRASKRTQGTAVMSHYRLC